MRNVYPLVISGVHMLPPQNKPFPKNRRIIFDQIRSLTVQKSGQDLNCIKWVAGFVLSMHCGKMHPFRFYSVYQRFLAILSVFGRDIHSSCRFSMHDLYSNFAEFLKGPLEHVVFFIFQIGHCQKVHHLCIEMFATSFTQSLMERIKGLHGKLQSS